MVVKERRRWSRKVQATFVCVLVLLSGCGRISPLPSPTATGEPTATLVSTPAIQGTRISFETIDLDHIPGFGNKDKYPYMIVLTQTDDTSEMEGFISKQAMEKLQDIDFNRELVIAVFQGWKPSTGYEIQIKWVIKINAEVVVGVALKNPPEGREVQQEVTSPYHLIQISKEDLNGTLKFTLDANGIGYKLRIGTICQD